MAFTYRPATLLLLLALPACLPKEDGGDDTGDDAGTSTTGEVTTSGDASDPTTPSTTESSGLSVSSTEPTAGTGGTASTSSPGTSPGTTTGSDPSDPSDPSTVTNMTTSPTAATTSATSTSTTAPDTGETSDPPDPVDPPVPCEGAATPLVHTTQIAYLKSQIPPRRDPTGGTATGTGGDELEPGTLFVKLSDQLFTCADPNDIIDCGPHWEVSIVIPPEFQTPGIHNLLGQDVRGSAFETGADEGMNECAFGGGSFSATFEIINIDDNVVEGRLCHVENFFFDNNPELEGSFVAPRCPL